MSEQNYEHTTRNEGHRGGDGRWFSFLYRTRVKVSKGEIPILNLSLLFSILTVLSAPWLAVAGFIVALALGYRFGIERNAAGFASDFQEVVRDAAGNVKSAVDSVVKDGSEE